MKEVKLSHIFESVSSAGIDLSSYPYTNNLINSWLSSNATYVFPDDFNDLLSDDPLSKKVLNLLSQRNTSQNLNTNANVSRVYDFYKEIFLRLYNDNDPNNKKYFLEVEKELIKLIDDILVYKAASNPQQNTSNQQNTTQPNNQNTSNQQNTNTNKIHSIIDTKDLKTNNIITVGGKNYYIEDNDISIFGNPNNKNANYYYGKMYDGDFSLPDDARTPEGKVYTLMKKLHNECTVLTNSLNKVKQHISYSPSVSNKSIENTSILKDVEMVHFNQLKKDGLIKFDYVLTDSAGNVIGNNYNSATFEYSPLTAKHRFINIGSRSNNIIFLNYSNNGLYKGGKYRIEYNDGNKSTLVNMEILNIALKDTKNINSNKSFETCNALDELISIIQLVKNI